MNKTKIKEITIFSFSKYFSNKWFIILNLIGLLSTIILMNFNSIQNIIPKKEEQKTFNILIIDNSNLILSELSNYFIDDEEVNISKINENTYTSENLEEDTGIIEVIPSDKEIFTIKFTSLYGIKSDLYEKIFTKVLELRNSILAQKNNITNENLEILRSNLNVERILLKSDTSNADIKGLLEFGLAVVVYFVGAMLFMKIAMEISQEKFSKSSEYILTCVSAKEYLFSKVFANILAFIIQGLLFIVYFSIAVLIGQFLNGLEASSLDISSLTDLNLNVEISPYFILSAIVFNILTFACFSFIQATLASHTSSSNEASNSTTIIIFILSVLMLVTEMIIVPGKKISSIIYILSCLPIFSGFFIPAIFLTGQANILQIIIALIMHIILIPISFKICVPIFKNGILDFSKVKKKEKIQKEITSDDVLNKKEFKKIGLALGISSIIYFTTQQLIPIGLSMLISGIKNSSIENVDLLLIILLLTSLLSVSLAYFFLRTYNVDTNKIKKKISFYNNFKIICIGLFLTFLVQALLTLIYPIIGLNYDYMEGSGIDVTANSSMFTKILAFLTMAVTPAIFEELFFRKGIMDLTKKHSIKFSVLISAFLFGLFHLNLIQSINAFLLGLVFSIIYAYTGNIILTMILHLLNNGIAVLELLGLKTIALILISLSFILGLIYFIELLIKKNYRVKLLKYNVFKIHTSSFLTKYKYMFYDFTFDCSLLLFFIAFFITEIKFHLPVG